MRELRVFALEGIGEVQPGDDLAAMILATGVRLRDGDILVVTSKVVSKAEDRYVRADDREDAITAETVRVVASRTRNGHTMRIVENRLGMVAAAAGVDASNTPDGWILLLPLDPDASARALATRLREATGHRVGVLLSDTLGRPWRVGQTDVAIGAAGVHVVADLRGTLDHGGRELSVTVPCVADELAAAADLVKGKASGLPVAVVRGRADLVGDLDLPGAASIVRTGADDLFRLGSDEARAQGYDEGYAAGIRSAGDPSSDIRSFEGAS
ncbi:MULTISPECIES: coenzyme F420-0:L-glutamate ligase [unclassified Microbacterium]|uniref:coenzyme F420-0:L-glutamate ligase n=1 Tax=unclassified Microbacterium TaxID=2609290 RepID=UPI0012F8E1AA|nr:coenzyme F420-0:L-glutamate ligase [Microbacterium sp. MAH-37]MVQ43999.1 coenzyme F420-0:L-glutamate ligase [Microbacterium sp. MAH-37]